MIERSLAVFLANDPGVAAMVVTPDQQRIFPLVIPQKHLKQQMPCIVYAANSETRSKGYCGTSATVEASISIDCYAPTLAVARQLNVALRRALLDYRGVMGDVLVKDVSLLNSISMVDMEPGLMRVADTYTVWYRERSD